MAFVLFQGEDTPHAPDMGGMEFHVFELEKIRKVIYKRIVAAGNQERPFGIAAGNR